ncbi:hypothetical protein [Pseudobutyrivibrio sp.]
MPINDRYFYFRDHTGKNYLVREEPVKTLEEALQALKYDLAERCPSYKHFYTRIVELGDNEYMFDYGSWNEFYYLIKKLKED